MSNKQKKEGKREKSGFLIGITIKAKKKKEGKAGNNSYPGAEVMAQPLRALVAFLQRT